jgi:hypothetical protein
MSKAKSDDTKMVRVTITLEPNQAKALKGLSAATGLNTSEIIRELITANATKIAKATTTAKRRKGLFE